MTTISVTLSIDQNNQPPQVLVPKDTKADPLTQLSDVQEQSNTLLTEKLKTHNIPFSKTNLFCLQINFFYSKKKTQEEETTAEEEEAEE